MHRSNYSRVETGDGDLSIDAISKIAKYFNMSIDSLVYFEGDFPEEVVLENKTELEQYKMMNQLDEEDKQTILKLVEKMLTNKKFKDFFAKNAEGL